MEGDMAKYDSKKTMSLEAASRETKICLRHCNDSKPNDGVPMKSLLFQCGQDSLHPSQYSSWSPGKTTKLIVVVITVSNDVITINYKQLNQAM